MGERREEEEKHEEKGRGGGLLPSHDAAAESGGRGDVSCVVVGECPALEVAPPPHRRSALRAAEAKE